eukprot:5407641-Pleurochrysis_carterae.AAC.1
MVHNKVVVCLGDHLDMLSHKHIKSTPLDAGYRLQHVRPLNLAEFEFICKEHYGATPLFLRSPWRTQPGCGVRACPVCPSSTCAICVMSLQMHLPRSHMLSHAT